MEFIAALLAAVVSGYQLKRMVDADKLQSDDAQAAATFRANEIRRKANIAALSEEKHNRLGFMLTRNLYRRPENGKTEVEKLQENWG